MKSPILILTLILATVLITSCGVKREKETLVIQDPILVGNPLIING